MPLSKHGCSAAPGARHALVTLRATRARVQACAHVPDLAALAAAQVVDETDRLLRQSYQNWLPHVVAAAARPQPAAGLPAAAAAVCSGAPPYPPVQAAGMCNTLTLSWRAAAAGGRLGNLVGLGQVACAHAVCNARP
jgi:hypothetical protein